MSSQVYQLTHLLRKKKKRETCSPGARVGSKGHPSELSFFICSQVLPRIPLFISISAASELHTIEFMAVVGP